MCETNKEIYSYHTFILPFSWLSKEEDYSSFVEFFDSNSCWVDTNMKDSNDINFAEKNEINEEKLSLYKEYQYFYPYARKAIYGFDEKIVRNFSFKPVQEDDDATYIICKDENIYNLLLNDIKLKIYNTGIALFIMECQNIENNNIAAVKNINEYGRRITLPFIPKDNKDSLCADMLIVKTENLEFISDFINYIDQKEITAKFVKEVLYYQSDYESKEVSSHKVDSKDKFGIFPILGDRMYVMSYINDEKAVRKALLSDVDGKENNTLSESLADIDPMYSYKDVIEETENLYELAYIDRERECTCKNKEMLGKLLDEALYKRWLNYGSLTFITNYSYVLLTTTTDDVVLNPFVTQYYQMFCLAISQRASIKVFKRKIAAISSEFKRKQNGRERKKIIQNIVKLEEEYIEFESQLCFDEVSPEQQGIELYDLIKKQFRLKDEIDNLKNQIEGLYNVANIRNSNESNNMMNALTWIAFFVSIASMFISSLQIGGFLSWITKCNAHEHTPIIMGNMSLEAIIVSSLMLIAVLTSIIMLIKAKSNNRNI